MMEMKGLDGIAAPTSGVLLGVDFGARRVGVAISDPEQRLAVPLQVLERRSDQKLIDELLLLATEHTAVALVLGEPRSPAGGDGRAAARVRRFAARLRATAGLPVVLVDETLTSVEADRRLRAAGVRPDRRRQRLDAVAAQILLEEALGGRRPPTREGSEGSDS